MITTTDSLNENSRLGPKMFKFVGLVESIVLLFEVVFVTLSIPIILKPLINNSHMVIYVSDILTFLYIYKRFNSVLIQSNWFGLLDKIQDIFTPESLLFIISQSVLFIILCCQQYLANDWYFTFKNFESLYNNNSTSTDVFKTTDGFLQEISETHMNFLNVYSLVVKAPFLEEILFRGLIYHRLEKRGSNSILYKCIGSSLFFGIIHLMNIFYSNFSVLYISVQTLDGIMYGINLALLYHLSQSLWTPFFIHLFNNLTAIFMPTHALDKISSQVYFIIIYQIITCLLFTFYLLKKVKSKERIKSDIHKA